MKDIAEFKIDQWARENAPKAKIPLYGSCAVPLSLKDLQQLHPAGRDPIDAELKLGYLTGGSTELRRRIAEIHSSESVQLTESNVAITTGSITANYLVLSTLFGPRDHLICQFPAYGQLYQVPKYNGVDVDLWAADPAKDWIPDVEDLRRMIRPNTKAIILNTPNNPTGAVLSGDALEQIIAIAEASNITIFADEVFRPLFHDPATTSPSIVSASTYPNTISTGSLSKAYSLPGVRIGWVVSPDAHVVSRITTARDYTTLAVSQVDDCIARFTLGPETRPRVLARNLSICARSLGVLEAFVTKHGGRRCRWVRPWAGAMAFVQVLDTAGRPADDVGLATRLADEKGVVVIPGGYCFGEDAAGDYKGYLRLSLGDPQLLGAGLRALEELLAWT